MTKANENNVTLTQVEKEVTAAEALDSAMNNIPDEMIEVDEGKTFVRSNETSTIKSLITRYKKGKIKIPACQRLYVWKPGDVDLLIDSVNHNFPIGMIILGECQGDCYLLDGLQRVTSLVGKLSEEKIPKEEKKAILDYKLIIETIHDMSSDDMNAFTQRCNMGVKMAAATKHRAGLPSRLFNMIVTLSGRDEYRQVKTNRTFTTSAHNELIAMHSLLASAKVPVGKSTAAELCKQLKAHNDEITQEEYNIADLMVTDLCNAFTTMKAYLTNSYALDDKAASDLAEHIGVKGLNVNFAAAMFRVMESDMCVTVPEIQYILKYVFEGRNAIKEYAATTSRSSSDEKSLVSRIELISKILNDCRNELKRDSLDDNQEQDNHQENENESEGQELDRLVDEIFAEDTQEEDNCNNKLVQDEMQNHNLPSCGEVTEVPAFEPSFVFNTEDYNVFCGKMMLKKTLTNSTGEYSVKFTDLSEKEKKDLFEADQTNDDSLRDSIIVGYHIAKSFLE